MSYSSKSIPHLVWRCMTSGVDQKTYWDLLETVMWICTREQRQVEAMWDRSGEERMALALSAMRVRLVVRSPPGPPGTNCGAVLEAEPQGSKGILCVDGSIVMGPSQP